ncbi:MAG: hypothetical protein SCK57_13055, partial [Bacillota bacterium]|nr:hypothetical protein [Bacillota bacterium]
IKKLAWFRFFFSAVQFSKSFSLAPLCFSDLYILPSTTAKVKRFFRFFSIKAKPIKAKTRKTIYPPRFSGSSLLIVVIVIQ